MILLCIGNRSSHIEIASILYRVGVKVLGTPSKVVGGLKRFTVKSSSPFSDPELECKSFHLFIAIVLGTFLPRL